MTGQQDEGDLDLRSYSVNQCTSNKYLGVPLSSNAKSKGYIDNKIAQGKRAKFNSVE